MELEKIILDQLPIKKQTKWERFKSELITHAIRFLIAAISFFVIFIKYKILSTLNLDFLAIKYKETLNIIGFLLLYLKTYLYF